MAYGQEGHLGMSFQNSLGTSNVDSMSYFEFISESLVETIEELQSESLSSRLEEPDDYEGIHTIAGDINLEVHPHSFGKILKAWSGQESVSYQNSCYSHLFLPRTGDWDAEKAALQPLSIEVYKDTGSAGLFFDMMSNTLVFEIAQGALVKATAGMVGAQFSWLNKSTPSYDPGSFWTWDTVSVSLAGNAVSDVSALTLTFNNNLEGKGYLDLKKYPSRILRTDFRTCEISGTMLLNGDTEARNHKNRTKQRLLITITDPTTVMLAHNQLVIDIPKMLYTEFPDNIVGTGLIEVGFSAKAKYDSDSSYAMQFTLVNTTPTY